MKSVNYPEYTCLLHAAKMLGKPVKWTDDRSDSFLSDSHGRASEVTAELALDAEGNFLAVRVNGYGNTRRVSLRRDAEPAVARHRRRTLPASTRPSRSK